MILFMTSSPCDDNVPTGVHLTCILDARNDFVKNLRACWKPDSRLVVVCSDPGNYPLNDEMHETFRRAFLYHGLTLSSSVLLDGRNDTKAAELIALSDVVLLGGGHVPTQHAFFESIRLPALMREYTGVVIGISAGSMNCAQEVYCQPELPGESVDPSFSRFIPGLALTRVNVLPHYQMVKDSLIDGKRLYEDVTFGDSFGRSLYVLVDGSYVLCRDGQDTLYGEGYLIRDGAMRQICRLNESVPII